MVENPRPKLQRIVSGGQTGADRGGLDAAIELGIPHGGWCPKGRLAEDGLISKYYDLKETKESGYPTRTRLNVQESDGTVVFTFGEPTGGSALTLDEAEKAKKPVLNVDLEALRLVEVATILREWCFAYRIKVLNVAGSRESKANGIQNQVREIVKVAFAPR
jgi:hypothetical protein